MARNTVQRQKGLTVSAFRAAYGNEEQCRTALVKWRFPNACPRVAARKRLRAQSTLAHAVRPLPHQSRLTAGTIFYATKLAMSVRSRRCTGPPKARTGSRRWGTIAPARDELQERLESQT